MDEFEEIIIDDSAVENGSLVTIPENIGHQTGFALFYMNLPGYTLLMPTQLWPHFPAI